MMRSNPYGQRNDGGWCQCAECGRTFGGLFGFDAHRMDVVKDPTTGGAPLMPGSRPRACVCRGEAGGFARMAVLLRA